MRIFDWLAELRYRDSLLYRIGLVHFILGVLLLGPLMIDDRLVLGINPWIKPIKFCISIGVYAWTFGWILFDIPGSPRLKKVISWTIGISMLVEMIVIAYQAGRGTMSHFNFETPFDGISFAVMGIMILINTAAIVVTFILYLVKKTNLDAAYLLSLRLAFIVFIIGNWVGSVMINNRQHSVGVEDGGPGLPFTNWSTEGGDLRIAHFLGLHAIQIIPLISFYLKKNTKLGLGTRRILAILTALIYGGLVSFLYFQAMRGQPLITFN